MGLFNFLDYILDPILSPLLNLPPFWAMLILSLIISVIITIIYKYTTDQKELKVIKEKQKKLQKQIKASSKEPEKVAKLNKELMSLSGSQMKQSFSSMIWTCHGILFDKQI